VHRSDIEVTVSPGRAAIVACALVASVIAGCGVSRATDAHPGRAADVAARRGLYIADTPALLGDETGAPALIRFARRDAIDRIVFYGLGTVFATPALETRLAALIVELRAAGVTAIGAPIAAASRVDEVLAYDRRHPEARFDLLVTELEYWNRCDRPATEAASVVRDCFAPMDELLAAMRAAAAAEAARGAPVRVGAYLGYPTAAEARRIAARADHVLLNYAVTTPSRPHVHVHPRGGPSRQRLRWLADAGLEVWPIFYARGEVDMAGWLARHGLAAAEAAFRDDVAADPDLADVRIGGFQYFPYEALREVAPASTTPPVPPAPGDGRPPATR